MGLEMEREKREDKKKDTSNHDRGNQTNSVSGVCFVFGVKGIEGK